MALHSLRFRSLHAQRNDLSAVVDSKSNAATDPAGQTNVWADAPYVVFLIAYTFFVSLLRGRNLTFWEDEVLGWRLLSDPSWKHMLTSWLQGADGGGISFYLMGRGWFALFGDSMLSFRLFSASCFSLAFVVLWLSMRHFYSRALSLFSILLACFSSIVLLQHYTEGRFYGLFMLAFSLALAAYFRCTRSETAKAALVLGVFLSHALLVTSHILGIVYSAALLFATFAWDFTESRFRTRIYKAVLGSWLLLLPCLPAIRASSAVGKPHFWTHQQGAVEFFSNYAGFTPKLALLLVLFSGVTFYLHFRRGTLFSVGVKSFVARRPVYFMLAIVFMIPPALYVEGLIGPPLGVSRYLLNLCLADACMLAEVITLALALKTQHSRPLRMFTAATACLFLIAIVGYDIFYHPLNLDQHTDYTQALTDEMPRESPIVCEDAFSFTELMYRQSESPVHYAYVLDWDHSVAPTTARLEVTQYHLMENWKKAGYYASAIDYRQQFLKEHPAFYSLSFEDLDHPSPFAPARYVDRTHLIGTELHTELARTGHYKVSLERSLPIGTIRANLWRICEVGVQHCA